MSRRPICVQPIRRAGPAVSAARCSRCLLSTIGWLPIRLVPHVYVVAFDSSPYLNVAGGLPLEFLRNATGRPFMAQATPLWVRVSWLYSLTAGLTVMAAAFVIVLVGGSA